MRDEKPFLISHLFLRGTDMRIGHGYDVHRLVEGR